MTRSGMYISAPKLFERMRGLHGQRYAHAECGQRDHRRRAHADEYHLPKDRRDFEKLAGEWRNQNPVEQAEIKLEIVFQNVDLSP